MKKINENKNCKRCRDCDNYQESALRCKLIDKPEIYLLPNDKCCVSSK